MLDLYLFQITVILGAEDKIVKLGETIVLGCITDANSIIWSYRNNSIDESITLMEKSAVNPEYTNKLTFVDKHCLQIINFSSQDEGIYSCYKLKQKSSIHLNLQIEGNFHFVFEYDIQQDYELAPLLCFIQNCVYG